MTVERAASVAVESEKASKSPVVSLRMPLALLYELERRAHDNYRSRNAEMLAILCREFGMTMPDSWQHQGWKQRKSLRGVPHGQ